MTAVPPDWRPTFSDAAGRVWRVDVTDALVESCGADDLDRLDSALRAGRLAAAGRLLVETLYAACEGQAIARGVAPEDFGRALARLDVIERGAAALVIALEIRRRARANAGHVPPDVLRQLADAFKKHKQMMRR